ncbi:MAG: hypothetical protein ACLRW3_00260 [Eubacterium sp.]
MTVYEKTKIICVVGATASGKTALGVELARLSAVIISMIQWGLQNMPLPQPPTNDEKPVSTYLLISTAAIFFRNKFVNLQEKITTLLARQVPLCRTGYFVTL